MPFGKPEAQAAAAGAEVKVGFGAVLDVLAGAGLLPRGSPQDNSPESMQDFVEAYHQAHQMLDTMASQFPQHNSAVHKMKTLLQLRFRIPASGSILRVLELDGRAATLNWLVGNE